MSRRVFQPGDRIGNHLTIVGTLDGGGREPVYIVWHAAAWCGPHSNATHSASASTPT